MRRFGTVAALLLLSACTMPATPSSTPSPQVSRFQTTDPLPSTAAPVGTATNLPEARLAAIRADLTTRKVKADELKVVSVESVTFNDGSLGCPQPGVQYTQGQVDGMKVVVDVAGRSYDYRFGRTDTPMLCERTVPQATNTTR